MLTAEPSPMPKPALDLETSSGRFLADPVGRYVIGRSYSVWCPRETLIGTTLCAVMSKEDLHEWRSLWQVARVLPRYDLLLDLGTLELDHVSLSAIAESLRIYTDHPGVHRHAIVLPADATAATLIAELPRLLKLRHEWRTFHHRGDACDWLGDIELGDAMRQIDAAMREGATGCSVLLALRHHLSMHPASTVEGAARSLGLSARGLQRALQPLGVSFRAEARRARMAAATRLLADGNGKIEAIAREVGYVSTSHFCSAFRAEMGMLPREYRKLRR